MHRLSDAMHRTRIILRLDARLLPKHRISSITQLSARYKQSFTTMSAPIPLPNHVYKIFPNTTVYQGTPIPVPSDWEFPQSEVDANDGFVHLSTLEQLPGTLSRFFGSESTVQLLKIDYKRLSSFKVVKWELASNGDTFPHLYAQLTGEFVRDLKLAAKGTSWESTAEDLIKQGWLEN